MMAGGWSNDGLRLEKNRSLEKKVRSLVKKGRNLGK